MALAAALAGLPSGETTALPWRDPSVTLVGEETGDGGIPAALVGVVEGAGRGLDPAAEEDCGAGAGAGGALPPADHLLGAGPRGVEPPPPPLPPRLSACLWTLAVMKAPIATPAFRCPSRLALAAALAGLASLGGPAPAAAAPSMKASRAAPAWPCPLRLALAASREGEEGAGGGEGGAGGESVASASISASSSVGDAALKPSPPSSSSYTATSALLRLSIRCLCRSLSSIPNLARSAPPPVPPPLPPPRWKPVDRYRGDRCGCVRACCCRCFRGASSSGRSSRTGREAGRPPLLLPPEDEPPAGFLLRLRDPSRGIVRRGWGVGKLVWSLSLSLGPRMEG